MTDPKRFIEFLTLLTLQQSLDAILISDKDIIQHMTGYSNYLANEFGRPTFLFFNQHAGACLITPDLEVEMCQEMAQRYLCYSWDSSVNGDWIHSIDALKSKYNIKTLGIDTEYMGGLELKYILNAFKTYDISEDIRRFIQIKSPHQIESIKNLGQYTCYHMLDAAKRYIKAGITEYKLSIEMITSGTECNATLLEDQERPAFLSPCLLNNLRIQTTGDLHKVHQKPTCKKLKKQDSVYICLCDTAELNGYHIGCDRQFYIGSLSQSQLELSLIAIEAQHAAVELLVPGVTANDIYEASHAIYKKHKLEPAYRIGRSTGIKKYEGFDIIRGNREIIKENMCIVIDAGIINTDKNGTKTVARIGNTYHVTPTGPVALTNYPTNPEQLLII